eukprot:scaffold10484_cov31-Tisochrysis_lutea.AAC.3
MGDALGAGEHRVDDQEWSRIAPVVDRSRALRDRDTVPVSRLVLPCSTWQYKVVDIAANTRFVSAHLIGQLEVHKGDQDAGSVATKLAALKSYGASH